LCVVAHPMRHEPGTSHRLTDEHAARLKELLPLVALEAYHPYHKPEEVWAAQQMAQRHGLLLTAGSDAHGYNVRRPPKPFPAAMSKDFLERLHDRWSAGPAPPSVEG